VAWLALLGLWMLLVDSTDFREALAGAVAATLGTAAYRLAVRRAAEGLLPALRRSGAWRLPWQAVTDSGRVLAAVVTSGLGRGRVRGRFESVPFAVGGSSAQAAGRRAVAAITQSFPPNTSVAGFEAEGGVMVVHRLVRSSGE
jgi:hypothetical protein